MIGFGQLWVQAMQGEQEVKKLSPPLSRKNILNCCRIFKWSTTKKRFWALFCQNCITSLARDYEKLKTMYFALPVLQFLYSMSSIAAPPPRSLARMPSKRTSKFLSFPRCISALFHWPSFFPESFHTFIKPLSIWRRKHKAWKFSNFWAQNVRLAFANCYVQQMWEGECESGGVAVKCWIVLLHKAKLSVLSLAVSS